MKKAIENYETKDFWLQENARYAQQHFRLRKCARIINRLAHGREWDLLDVGCGPAALLGCLDNNISYHGIDIALHDSKPYLVESDFVQNRIRFKDKRFDIVVAQGVFEYMGAHQAEKFAEIAGLLKEHGKFLMTYMNFDHISNIRCSIYNNIQSIVELMKDLQDHFRVEQFFPAYHHWRQKQPGRNALPSLQMRLNRNIPVISHWFAVEYFLICSRRDSGG